jgi:proline iminopeptidase
MKPRTKKIVIVVSIVVALIAIVGIYLFSMMSKPMYKSGMVREGKNLSAPLVPPAQDVDTDSLWKVEDDIKLYHFSKGSGEKVLVIHGGPGFPFSEPLAGLSPLADRYSFIYYDQRGCGKSTRPFDKFSSSNFYKNATTLEKKLGLGAQLADIERIRQILKEDKLTLVGHSFGAFLAALYAAEFPEHVKRLVLIAPANVLLRPSPDGDLFTEISKLLPENMKSDYAEFQKRYFDFNEIFALSEDDLIKMNAEFGKFYVAALNGKGITLPKMPNNSKGGGWMVTGMYFSMGKKCDYRDALKNVKAPVLVIHGEKDLQPESVGMMYVHAFHNAQLKVISNASHFPFVEQPQEFAQVVDNFFKSN